MEFKIYRTTEAEIIEGCKRHERKAQKLLFDTFSPRLYALCRRYIKDSMEAEDVVVKAFTKIFDRIHQFKGEGSFEGWIKRIIINEALVYLRKNRMFHVELDQDMIECDPDYQTLENHLEAEDLLFMIQSLPSGYRIVFNLYAMDGLTHKEIAAQLGISENTSKSQLSRARTYLKKLLAEQEIPFKKKMHETTTRQILPR